MWLKKYVNRALTVAHETTCGVQLHNGNSIESALGLGSFLSNNLSADSCNPVRKSVNTSAMVAENIAIRLLVSSSVNVGNSLRSL